MASKLVGSQSDLKSEKKVLVLPPPAWDCTNKLLRFFCGRSFDFSHRTGLWVCRASQEIGTLMEFRGNWPWFAVNGPIHFTNWCCMCHMSISVGYNLYSISAITLHILLSNKRKICFSTPVLAGWTCILFCCRRTFRFVCQMMFNPSWYLQLYIVARCDCSKRGP